MDLGSIEDLLRPASLAERKKRLGLLDDGTPSKRNLAQSAAISDSRLSLKEQSFSSPQHKHRCLSPNLKKNKSVSSDHLDRSLTLPPQNQQQKNKKRRRMENRPPLAPKPDSIPPPPPPTTGVPVAKPRKKPGAPPPAKPMPYRKHVELKDKAVTTFKSDAPVAPPRIRQRPTPPLKPPPPPSYRLSTPGEPSDDFYQPKSETQAPLQYSIPVVPKRPNVPPPPSSSSSSVSSIDKRPRLDTPQVVPDPDDIVLKGRAGSPPLQGGDVKLRSSCSPVRSYGSNPGLPTAPRDAVNGISAVEGSSASSRDGVEVGYSSGDQQPELYAEAYAEVQTEENDTEYAVVSPSRKAVVPSPLSSSAPTPPPVRPLPRVPSPLHNHPVPVRRHTPPITSQLHHRSPSPTPSPPTSFSPKAPPSSSVVEGIDDHEYNVTSHVKQAVRKRSDNAPPLTPPTSFSPKASPPSSVVEGIDDHEYNVTSHVKEAVRKRSRDAPLLTPPISTRPQRPPRVPKSTVKPSTKETDEYSVLDRPDKRQTTPPAVAQDFDEYSVLGSGDRKKGVGLVTPPTAQGSEEYSVLGSEEPLLTNRDEGYGQLDIQAVAKAITSASSATSSSPNNADSSLYEEVKSDAPTNLNANEVDAPPLPVDRHPRVIARKASKKLRDDGVETTALSSRDRSKLPAYRHCDDTFTAEVGMSKLPPRSRAPPPVPHAKRQKKMPAQQNDDMSPTPPDSANRVSTEALEEAGYETVNTFSPPPEEMETDSRKEDKKPAKSPKPPKKVPLLKARSGKPPPLPKPKQIASPAQSRQKSDTVPVSERAASSTSEKMDYEPVCNTPPSGNAPPLPPHPHPSTVEAEQDVDSSSADIATVTSPKIELDIDHITLVGSAIVNQGVEEESLYDNQRVVNAVSSEGSPSNNSQRLSSVKSEETVSLKSELSDTSQDQKRSSRSSGYENQAVMESSSQNQDDEKMEVDGIRDDQAGVADGHDALLGETDATCTALSPSEIFTVPQHAIPGRDGYCDIDRSEDGAGGERRHHFEIPPPHPATQNLTDGVGDDVNGTFTVPPHSYPDPQGYCDIEIQSPPSANVAVGANNSGVEKEETTNIVRESDGIVTDARGYCDIDIQPLPTCSHQYEFVSEVTKTKPRLPSSSPPSKAPLLPSGKPSPGNKSHDNKRGDLGKASSDAASPNKKTPPKRPPPRRRAPPPPPMKSKTVEEPNDDKSSQLTSSLKNELVISTGLATIPRSPKKQPPKPPPPFSSSNSPLLSKKMSPQVGRKHDINLPLVPTASPSLSSPQTPGSPKGWDTTESPQSGGGGGGIKKKFKGFFNKSKQSSASSSPSAAASSGDGVATSSAGGSTAASGSNSSGFGRRPSWKKKNKGALLQGDSSAAQLSPKSKTKSLPGNARKHAQPAQPLQFQTSYDADQEDDDEFGIYSTINEGKMKTPSSAGAMATAPVNFNDEKEEEQDESGYDVVDKKQRSVSISVKKKKKKSGKKGFETRRASSVEHLYESADFEDDAGMPKSASNSPHVPRRSPGQVGHAPSPMAGPALHIQNRNLLAGPPNLEELKGGKVDTNQLYAQVVPSPKQQPKIDKQSSSKDADSAAAMVANGPGMSQTGIEDVAGASSTTETPPGGRDGEAKLIEGLVVTSLDEKFGRGISPEKDMLSAEIEHTLQGEDAYAVVSTQLKKDAAKRRKKKFKEGKSDGGTVQPLSDGNEKEGQRVGDGGEVVSNKTPGKVPPPKPPKSYREHIASSGAQTPSSNVASSDKTEGDGQRHTARPISPRNMSPPPSQLDVSLGLTPQERTRVASFSSGPPSFPPPPPPKSASPDVISESFEDELEDAADSTTKKTAKRKAPPRPHPFRVQNGALGEGEPGYEATKNERKTTGRSKKDGAAKNPPGLVHVDKVSKPHLSPSQRRPHVYSTFEDVQDELGDLKTREGSITVPMKTPSVGYATVSSSNTRRGSMPQPAKSGRSTSAKFAKHPKLSPKSRPPPPPPGQRRPGDAANSASSPQKGAEAGAVDEHVGKRIFVSMENSPTSETNGPEPKFLFSHAQKFIVVGETENPPQMTNSYEEDSDGEVLDSTDWETSSGEEEAEEQVRAKSPEPKEPRPKTFYIAREILTTERTFVKGLTLIDKDFRQAVKSANNAHEKPVITEEGLKIILGNVSSLLTLNSGLLQELEERMAQWSTNPCIGDILLCRAPYFKIYTEYISKFDKALKTLEEFTKKNPVFAQVLKEFESQPKCANLPLAGYMLDIVQRITRYKLLLADYVKHLPDDSPDKDPSQKALVIISSVATHVNETVRQMDNFRKVCDVRKKLIGDSGDTLITPHRKLLKEGELMKFSRKEKQPRMFFLFNDILIYASSIPPANTTYKVIKRIPLEGMRVELLDDPEMRYGFQIISTCKSFRLEASNREDLHQWMSAFEVAIKDHCDRKKRAEDKVEETDSSAPLGSLAPPWLPDSAVSMCQLCSAHFTVTRRRHHCRACGKIFCSECSSYLAPLKYKNNKLGRVCQVCYETLPKNDDTMSAKKTTSLQRGSKSRVSLPSVLKEVKARDQSAQVSGYLLTRSAKSRKWKKRWFVVFNLVLYEFERHEDVSAKRSITLPSYQVVKHDSDPLVFVLNHPGTGKEYFKEDSPEQLERWIEVLEKAVLGEIEEEEEPTEEEGTKETAEAEDEEETADESSPSHLPPPMDTPSDTPSDATQSPSKESSQEQPRPLAEEDETSSS